MAPRCPAERIEATFALSILHHPEHRRPGVLDRLAAAPRLRVIRLRSERDIVAFLESI